VVGPKGKTDLTQFGVGWSADRPACSVGGGFPMLTNARFPLLAAIMATLPTTSFGESCTPANIATCARWYSTQPCMQYTCDPALLGRRTKVGKAGPPSYCVLVQKDVGSSCFSFSACIPYGYGACNAHAICEGSQVKCNTTTSAREGVQCSCANMQCRAICTDNSCWNAYTSDHGVLNAAKVCKVASGGPAPGSAPPQ
jgi:hypothetical protein